jgi:methyl-accepting chemotaxis protein
VEAQEVRELAERSAKAAKEIKDLIGRSSDMGKNGVELVIVDLTRLRHDVLRQASGPADRDRRIGC